MKFEIKVLFSVAVLTSISYSIVNAFFAPIAIKKNVSESTIGMFISVYSFVIICLIPFISYFVEMFGRKYLFVNSLILQIIFTSLYGIIAYIQDEFIFVCACFLLRISHGISSAFNINLLISTTAKLSHKDEVNNNFAMIDLGWMFGKFCGPTIISIVYSFGGLFSTFLFSSLTMLISYFYVLKIPLEEEEIRADEKKENFFTSLEKTDIFIIFFAQFLNMLSKTFSGPLIFNHITNAYGISLEQASKLSSLSFLSYYLTIYYIDRIINKFGTKMTIAVGILINFIAVNLLFPISIFPQTAILIALGFFLLGFPSGCIDIPVMVDLVSTLSEKYEYPDHLANDITSSIYTFANQLGESLGPIYGGFISQSYGFEFSCIFTGLLNLVFFSFFYNLYKKFMFRKPFNETGELMETNQIELADNDLDDEKNLNDAENDLKEKLI